MPSLTITMRADSAEHPSSGYLEHYMGQDALVTGRRNVRPSIQMAAAQIFGGECAKHILFYSVLNGENSAEEYE